MRRNDANIHVETATRGAPIWVIGWLFTIGYAQLPVAKGLLAVLIWPYYLGVALT